MRPIIVYINLDKADETILERIGARVRAGALVAYLTSTGYKIGVNPFNTSSIERLYRVTRGFHESHAAFLVTDIESAKLVAEVTADAEKLMKMFWPGRLALILKAKFSTPLVNYRTTSVRVEAPSHPVLLTLVKSSGGVLMVVNGSSIGGQQPRTVEDLAELVSGHVNYIIDMEPKLVEESSTVVDLTVYPPRLVSLGPITLKELEEALGIIVQGNV